MSMIDLDIGGIVEGVGDIADDLFTTDEERLQLALENRKVDAALLAKVHETNIAEAQHRSIFVAGWRPMIGWMGAAAMGYNFIGYPLLLWANSIWNFAPSVPPMVESGELFAIVTGMLGIAGMRSFEKFKGLTK